MENFIGIGIPDPAEEVWIGEDAFQGVVMGLKDRSEVFQRGFKDVETAGILFS